MTAQEVIALLGLQPLPQEGGFYRETYRCAVRAGDRCCGTAIYYLITPESPSRLHRVASDEVFHFYLGDPAEQLLLLPDGSARRLVLGTDLAAGQRPQSVVPARAWQATRLVAGGRFALLGTTVSPGFEFADYEQDEADAVAAGQPAWRELLRQWQESVSEAERPA